MYRIELSPSEETAFRTIEELAVAIRRGIVTSRARIYHNASNKWLPIQFHPHYKLAVSMKLTQADLVAGPSAKPRSALNIQETGAQAPKAEPPAKPVSSGVRQSAVQAALAAWPPLKPLAETVKPPAATVKPSVAPAHQEPAAPAPARQPTKTLTWIEPPKPLAPPLPSAIATRPEEPPRKKRSRTGKRARRSMRLALAGALLIASTHLVVGPGGMKLALFPGAAAGGPELPIVSVPTASKMLRKPKPATPPLTAAATKPEVVAPKPDSVGLKPGAPSPKASKVVSPPRPAPVAPVSKPTVVAPPPSTPDSVAVSTIEPPPSTIEMAVPSLSGTEMLAPKMVDSSGKKSLKRILRAIEGMPAPESKQPKH